MFASLSSRPTTLRREGLLARPVEHGVTRRAPTGQVQRLERAVSYEHPLNHRPGMYRGSPIRVYPSGCAYSRTSRCSFVGERRSAIVALMMGSRTVLFGYVRTPSVHTTGPTKAFPRPAPRTPAGGHTLRLGVGQADSRRKNQCDLGPLLS